MGPFSKRDPRGLPSVPPGGARLKVSVISLGISRIAAPRSGFDGVWRFHSAFIRRFESGGFYRRLKDKLGKSSRSQIKCSLFNPAGKSVEMRRSGSLLKWTVNKMCVGQ